MSRAGPGQAGLVIRGGDVIDGTGKLRYAADVVVQGGLISAVVPRGGATARRVIDARGLVVCPGFIDSHSHDDQLVLEPRARQPKLAQGVCTVVTGNCGISLAPLLHSNPPPPLDLLGPGTGRYGTFAAYIAALDAAPPGINVVPLVGHTSIRVNQVDDLERTATADEIAAMHAEVAKALDAGAFGLSTGVYYPPARAASTAELMGVCAALRGRNAVLAMHIRDEGDNVDAAIQEALDVGGQCGANLVLSHHKVVGRHNQGRTVQTLGLVDAAARSQSVCMDCYPYEASSTMLSAAKAAQTGNVLISWSQPHPEQAGRTLKSIAGSWDMSLLDAAQRLMPGGAIYFSMAGEDVDRVLQHPLTMIGSDGLPHDARPHPRLWGTFPRVLGHYSRDRGLFPLETAVHKMTGLPARRFGLRGRGVIAPGNAADLVIFDAREIRDNATYGQPDNAPTGIVAVLVNGQLAMWQGEPTQVSAGRRLRPGGGPA
jgi:N-acyl-D-amino-acid deacylase